MYLTKPTKYLRFQKCRIFYVVKSPPVSFPTLFLTSPRARWLPYSATRHFIDLLHPFSRCRFLRPLCIYWTLPRHRLRCALWCQGGQDPASQYPSDTQSFWSFWENHHFVQIPQNPNFLNPILLFFDFFWKYWWLSLAESGFCAVATVSFLHFIDPDFYSPMFNPDSQNPYKTWNRQKCLTLSPPSLPISRHPLFFALWQPVWWCKAGNATFIENCRIFNRKFQSTFCEHVSSPLFRAVSRIFKNFHHRWSFLILALVGFQNLTTLHSIIKALRFSTLRPGIQWCKAS